ncbi:MAG: hypothetical protein CVU50_02060 [Candidatus Cloacimonetes bacterium HGW-Cloacimonetes-3]|jgi:hypothetical protein|nr:MAG: hypothetical protein CVU50_02060 [Candidatus Cloacimonetes bacterium HGW-Cloacimonetes-3]
MDESGKSGHGTYTGNVGKKPVNPVTHPVNAAPNHRAATVYHAYHERYTVAARREQVTVIGWERQGYG